MKKKRFLAPALFAMAVAGCSGQIYIEGELPETAGELREVIADSEATIDGLEEELKQARESRDVLAEADRYAEGYFARSESGRRLSRAVREVDFIVWRMTYAKKRLAKATARLQEIEAGIESEGHGDDRGNQ